MSRAAILPLTFCALLTANIWQVALSIHPAAPASATRSERLRPGSEGEDDVWAALIYQPTILFAFGTMIMTAGLWWHTAVLAAIGKEAARNFKAAERAHVSVLTPASKFIVDANRDLLGVKVWVIWRNSGRTPAAPMLTKTAVTWTNAIVGFDFDAIDQAQDGAERIIQPLVLGPGADITTDALFIGAEHIRSAASGTGHQFFFGRATYRDIFEGTADHVIEFCFKLSVEGDVFHPIQEHGVVPEIRFGIYGDRNRYYDKVQ